VPGKLSVVIPCFNEEHHIRMLLEKVISVKLDHNLEKELIIINDGSTDGTSEVLRKILSENPEMLIIHQTVNMGKGAAIRNGLSKITGDIVIIQDADLEYDPADYNTLLQPIIGNKADVVYGSRFKGNEPKRKLVFLHTTGNRFLTSLSNLFTGLNLTDMETCYKTFKTDVIKQININENRFGFEPEITAKVSRIKNVRICEVPISYTARTYATGKKIKWTDGFHAIWCILKYNIFSRK
jgi:glycosyltransferase involved in cell wall biosynthesis